MNCRPSMGQRTGHTWGLKCAVSTFSPFPTSPSPQDSTPRTAMLTGNPASFHSSSKANPTPPAPRTVAPTATAGAPPPPTTTRTSSTASARPEVPPPCLPGSAPPSHHALAPETRLFPSSVCLSTLTGLQDGRYSAHLHHSPPHPIPDFQRPRPSHGGSALSAQLAASSTYWCPRHRPRV